MTGRAEELAGEAHLYLAVTDEWTRSGGLERALRLLSPEESERYGRFRFAAPARAFATGRALARQVLSLYADAAPADWRLEPDEHGRPRIAAPPGTGLELNLSHDDRLVACLVTGGAACGVDLESVARRVDPLRIAGHSFGEEEQRDLAGRAGADLRRRFFAYWTLKEAYLKARGRGIAMRMDSALFHFPTDDLPGRIGFACAPRAADDPHCWQFALYRADDDRLVAVALRRRGGEDLAIRSFAAQPGAPRAGVAALELLAASQPAARTGR